MKKSYTELQSLIASMSTEISQLKQLLLQHGIDPSTPLLTNSDPQTEISSSGINSHSSPEDKIKIFKDLFKGRNDVFAIRWQNKTGKSGYSPACRNDRIFGICKKFEKLGCKKCEYKDLKPLTDQEIHKHLTGSQTIGIYPLLPDDHCWFLAVDFDKKEWMKDVKDFSQTCKKYDLNPSIERSRSGNGAHVWFFFSEPVPAGSARRLGCALLTATMEKRYQIGMDSYDRLFPNQDTMPQGGYGNLIALPLQKSAREYHNSEFINNDFIPYQDQWNYLAHTEKYDQKTIEKISWKILKNSSPLGTLKTFIDDEKPWEKSVLNKEPDFDVPPEIIAILSDKIYIDKTGLSQKLLNRIVRLASFSNQEFYQTQALRLPIYNIPRVINLSDDSKQYLAIPRGCLDDLKDLVFQKKSHLILQDKTNHGIPINISFNGHLTYEQNIAGNKLLNFDNAVLSASTAFGKTVLAIWLMSKRRVNTLIIVHRRQLLLQWKEKLALYLNISPSLIGEIGGGKEKPTQFIDVALIQSLHKDHQVKQLVRDYGMIIVDECHHISAFSFETVLKECNARYIYGLTATPIRKDGKHPIVMMQCGPIRHKVNNKKQAELRPFDHLVVTRKTDLLWEDNDATNITAVYQKISTNENRNNQIIEDVIKSVTEGRKPLILTERTAHIKILQEKLTSFVKNIIILKGGMSPKKLNETLDLIKEIPFNEERIIIATGRFIGEGFDDNQLDTLFLTMPIAWRGTLQQYAGRLHRLNDQKKQVIIYDYVDEKVPVLEKMYRKRIKGYESMGYTLQD